MPVEDLPSTLEGALSALIKENPLTSFEIDRRGDSIVVVLRFSTGQPNDTATQRYRLKPPSQAARDKRRADIRKGQASTDSFPTPLFMTAPPGQLTEKPQETSPMTSDLAGLHQRYDTFRTTLHVNPAPLPLRRRWTVRVLFGTLNSHLT